jgi:hypothetical protein
VINTAGAPSRYGRILNWCRQLISRAQYEARILELIEDTPSLQVIIEPMLAVRRVVREQYVILHKKMLM